MVTRILLSVATRIVTLNAFGNITMAVWVGQFGGIPTNIEADSDESYMMWAGHQQVGAVGAGPGVVLRTFDLRGQRASRSDSENIHFVVRADAASAIVTAVWLRVLVLLP